MNASSFTVINNLAFEASVAVNGQGTPTTVGSGDSVMIPITSVAAGDQAYPAVTVSSNGGGEQNGSACNFAQGAPSASYTLVASELFWGIEGPAQAS